MTPVNIFQDWKCFPPDNVDRGLCGEVFFWGGKKGLIHSQLHAADWWHVIVCISLSMQEDPYVMVRRAELEGYCIDLLKALASMLHFSYKVKVVGDGKYGAVSSNGNWTGMIGEILRQVIFIVCL